MAKRKLRYGLFVVFAVIVVILLGLKEPVTDKSPVTDESADSPGRGTRILAIDVSTAADNDYDGAFSLAKSVGMQEVGLYFNWEDVETAPGRYDNPYFAIANTYYPPTSTMVSLTIVPIHTNQLVVPSDLLNTSFDDAVMINRFTAMLDWVLTQIPDVELHSLVIGSEFDVYFGTDERKWEEYQTFYKAVAAHIRTNYKVKVAAEATFHGLTGDAQEYLKVLNEYSDVIGVSYYPLNDDFTVKDPSVVKSDFDAITALYKGEPIFFYQLGYPSSGVLGSSQEKQKQFIEEVFKAWDVHSSQIQLIDFTWLHDMPPEAVEEFKQFYGVADKRFAEFLATLGLRTYAGEDKEGFKALREEARARGW